MKETNEQQVEELEKENDLLISIKTNIEDEPYDEWSSITESTWNENEKDIKSNIEKAKQLKEEIEKGCKKEFNVIKYKKESREYKSGILGEGEYCLATNLCPKCQELINRLNKIIGETNEE